MSENETIQPTPTAPIEAEGTLAPVETTSVAPETAEEKTA